MGKYSVPEGIRAMKPRGTMVKAIGGRYYVYEYRCVSEGGVSRTRMGRCVGKIEEGSGFVPNDSAASSPNAAVREAAVAAGRVAADAASAGAAERDKTENAQLRARVAELGARVAELEAALSAVREATDRALGAR